MFKKEFKMNEQIKKLMLAAGYAAPEIALRAQKLTELVVHECLNFIEPMPGSNDKDDLALGRANNSIKEHFGIK